MVAAAEGAPVLPDPILDPMAQVISRLTTLEKQMADILPYAFLKTWLRLAEVIAGPSGLAEIKFDSIDQGFAHIRIVGLLRSDRADTGESVGLQFNGDTAGHYTSNRARFYHPSTVTTSERLADTFMSLTGVCGDSAPAGAFGVVDYFIPSYADPNVSKSIACVSHHIKSTAAGGPEVEISGGTWLGGAITSVRLYPAAGGTKWKQYSHLTLYGLS